MSQLRRIRKLGVVDSTDRRRVPFKSIAFEENLILMEFGIMSV